MKNIIIADNQDITRVGLESILNGISQISSIDFSENKSELIVLLKQYDKAVVILDYTLFDIRGVEELLNLSERFNKISWLLFSEELSSDFLKRLLFSKDSFGVVLKSASLNEITMALQQLLSDEPFISSKVINQLLASQRSLQKEEISEVLTVTEKEILKELALGKTTKEIAANRNLSIHTVMTHRKNIFRKIEVNNVHEATKYAIRAGIVDVSDYYI